MRLSFFNNLVIHKYSRNPLDLPLQNIGPGQNLNIYKPELKLMCHFNTGLFWGCNFVSFSVIPNCQSPGNLCRYAFISNLARRCVCLFTPEMCFLGLIRALRPD